METLKLRENRSFAQLKQLLRGGIRIQTPTAPMAYAPRDNDQVSMWCHTVLNKRPALKQELNC